jgi:class 3 adenylate cyclase
MDDVGAVLDAVGSESAAVYGGARGAAMSMLFAASHPERTRSLVLYAPLARSLRSPDWPYGRSPEEQRDFYDRFVLEMGTAKNLSFQAPDHEPTFEEWWARFERLGASPGQWRELAGILGEIDVRSVLPNIHAPTLVLQRSGDLIVDAGQSRAVAERIEGAKYVELEGRNHLPFLGDPDAIVDEIEEFVTGVRPAPLHDRVLSTVLFTDIVDSTRRASELGDHGWRELLERHNGLIRGLLARSHGREVDTAGDGFLAQFDGPARAVRCALGIVEGVRAFGLEVRAGVHTGEVELIGDNISGITVHIGARVAALAGPGEVLVSRTVVDLVAGSDLEFEDYGEREFKGVSGAWKIFRVLQSG